VPRRKAPDLASDLEALRANNVTSATFHPDGRLASVEMTPLVGQVEEQDERGTISLPGQVLGGGHPKGGPATAPAAKPGKPRDVFRDLLLAQLPPAQPMDETDLPEDSDGFDDADIDGPRDEGEAPIGEGEAGLPNLGPGQDT